MKYSSDFPKTIGTVAARELALNNIRTLKQAAKHSETDLLAIHGVGPKAVRIIKEELAKMKLQLKTASKIRTTSQQPATKHRIYTMSFASVYPHYVAKAEKKGRTKAEVDEIIRWLTGYTKKGLESQIKKQTDFETFLAKAPKMNPARTLITGVVCGIRVEEVKEQTMREIRYLDKLVDELAKGKTMEKILRK